MFCRWGVGSWWVGLLFCVVASADPAPAPGFEGRGAVPIVWTPVLEPAHQPLAHALERDATFAEVASSIESLYALPADLTIVFRECHQANAFYDPRSRTISICYELIRRYLGDRVQPPQTRADARPSDVVLFTVLHELAHGLVDVLAPALDGAPEDLADEFAIFTLLDLGRVNALRDALAQLEHEARRPLRDERAGYWDTARRSAEARQRRVACLVYGGDPIAFGGAARRAGLSEEEALACADTHVERRSAWRQALAPHRAVPTSSAVGAGPLDQPSGTAARSARSDRDAR